ncbi:Photosystem II 12 kDa extrinsic protein, chloroplastic [Symbiodinium microadriaticum]|uniref:Photosystem II 12 kDa extrinsic protein n=2 Tax=Symbiodinium TaxID=2949 RepID=A0A1Q9CH78_SYMMI|nr:Photosystem II 12 kDa extrinsic protein, chloroplastic [Symbiodinium microadriaticum]OLP82292.1 Photosystem II 12 kDa extrinsic protein, chloroplastic [Symbiodinium microadriaticum]
MARVLLAALLLASPVAAFVAPGTGVTTTESQGRAVRLPLEPVEETFDEASNSNVLSVLTAGFGVGAVLGWLNSRKQQLVSTAAAAAVAVAPGAAQAMVDYDGIKYLGGTDKVDINNANIQAYRQFPGMFPTIAGLIGTHGPYSQVSDIYNIPGMDDKLKNIAKKYEGNLVCLPASPAYFIDRINNGLYR